MKISLKKPSQKLKILTKQKRNIYPPPMHTEKNQKIKTTVLLVVKISETKLDDNYH